MYEPEGESAVLLNGGLFKEGETVVENFKIEKIEEKYIILSKVEARYKLKPESKIPEEIYEDKDKEGDFKRAMFGMPLGASLSDVLRWAWNNKMKLTTYGTIP
jgi:hypothetical protein